MSKRRDHKGKYAVKRSARAIMGVWVAAILSLGLLAVVGRALLAEIGSFRACDPNSDVLGIHSCGKQGVNVGDFILLGFFVLAAILTISFCNAAWQTISRRAK
jgi:hypothetical protein